MTGVVLEVELMVLDDVLVVELTISWQSRRPGPGDASATGRDLGDDVVSRQDGGSSYWVLASFVGSGDDVWVLISRLGVV